MIPYEGSLHFPFSKALWHPDDTVRGFHPTGQSCSTYVVYFKAMEEKKKKLKKLDKIQTREQPLNYA